MGKGKAAALDPRALAVRRLRIDNSVTIDSDGVIHDERAQDIVEKLNHINKMAKRMSQSSSKHHDQSEWLREWRRLESEEKKLVHDILRTEHSYFHHAVYDKSTEDMLQKEEPFEKKIEKFQYYRSSALADAQEMNSLFQFLKQTNGTKKDLDESVERMKQYFERVRLTGNALDNDRCTLEAEIAELMASIQKHDTQIDKPVVSNFDISAYPILPIMFKWGFSKKMSREDSELYSILSAYPDDYQSEKALLRNELYSAHSELFSSISLLGSDWKGVCEVLKHDFNQNLGGWKEEHNSIFKQALKSVLRSKIAMNYKSTSNPHSPDRPTPLDSSVGSIVDEESEEILSRIPDLHFPLTLHTLSKGKLLRLYDILQSTSFPQSPYLVCIDNKGSNQKSTSEEAVKNGGDEVVNSSVFSVDSLTEGVHDTADTSAKEPMRYEVTLAELQLHNLFLQARTKVRAHLVDIQSRWRRKSAELYSLWQEKLVQAQERQKATHEAQQRHQEHENQRKLVHDRLEVLRRQKALEDAAQAAIDAAEAAAAAEQREADKRKQQARAAAAKAALQEYRQASARLEERMRALEAAAERENAKMEVQRRQERGERISFRRKKLEERLEQSRQSLERMRLDAMAERDALLGKLLRSVPYFERLEEIRNEKDVERVTEGMTEARARSVELSLAYLEYIRWTQGKSSLLNNEDHSANHSLVRSGSRESVDEGEEEPDLGRRYAKPNSEFVRNADGIALAQKIQKAAGMSKRAKDTMMLVANERMREKGFNADKGFSNKQITMNARYRLNAGLWAAGLQGTTAASSAMLSSATTGKAFVSSGIFNE